MPNPIKWESKIILAKPEVTYGISAAPTGADAMLMKNVEFRPMEGEDVQRNLERPFMGADEDYPTGLRSQLTGSVELVGSGETGVAPAWGRLLRACAVAEVVTPDDNAGDGTVTYSPVSDGHESVTLHFFIGRTRHVLLGARGTAAITLNAQGLPEIRFTFWGLFATPSEQDRPVPGFEDFALPEVVTHKKTPVFTIGGQPFVMREFGFDLGNDVQPRLLVGRETIEIVDRTEAITARVEAVPLTTFNPFAIAESRARQAVVIRHGTEAGRRVEIAAPVCSLKRLSGYEQSQKILEWPLALTPLPTSGDDQWTMTLS